MIDRLGRTIDYMRISITDQCNLRCTYCMPGNKQLAQPGDILSYEEILRLCRLSISLGIVNFKITGGEPLTRPGCVDFISSLKSLPGTEQVTITTNGLLLPTHLDSLHAAGIDGINISLDTLHDDEYEKLTGYRAKGASLVKQAMIACIQRDIPVKVNTVLLNQSFADLTQLAELAAQLPIAIRFIELMPIGAANTMEGISAESALLMLKESWPDLHPVEEHRGNGPARYYAATELIGRIGFIDAMSLPFCDRCNRIRLTATGDLMPCLCQDVGCNLRDPMRMGCTDEVLRASIQHVIWNKPRKHHFLQAQSIVERKTMNQIGG